jgi:hypothetical protein
MKILNVFISTLLLTLGNQVFSQTSTELSEPNFLQFPENKNLEQSSGPHQQLLEEKTLIPTKQYKISMEEKILRREEEREVMIKSNPIH